MLPESTLEVRHSKEGLQVDLNLQLNESTKIFQIRSNGCDKHKDYGLGSWTDEPDSVFGSINDLPFAILRGRAGSLCGYIGIQDNHPWIHLHYDKVPVEVHGGLTFAGTLSRASLDKIAPWWLGFDCAHFNDLVPGYNSFGRTPSSFNKGATYRTITYVLNELESLAHQYEEALNE